MPTLFDLYGIPPDDEQEAVKKPPASGATGRGFKEAFQQLPQLGYGLMAGAGAAGEASLGEGGLMTGIKNAGIKGYNAWGDKIAAGAQDTDSFNYSYDAARDGDFGAMVEWFKHGLGYTVGQGVQALASAGLGSVGGKMVLGVAAKDLAKGLVLKEADRIGAAALGENLTQSELISQATKNVMARASDIGQKVAVGGMAFGQEGGEIFGDLTSTAQKEGRQLTGAELGKAFAASLGAGALEFVGDKFGLDLVLGKSKLGAKVMSGAEGMTGLGGKVARGALAGTVAIPAEAGTEYFQTGLEEYGKGNEKNLLPFNQSEESQLGALDAAALGALGGGGTGLAGGLLSRARQNEAQRLDATDRLATATNANDIVAAAQDLAMAPLDDATPVLGASGMRRPGAYTDRAEAANTIEQIRQLPPDQQQEALGLLSAAGNMAAPGHVRRYAQNRLDELLLIPVGEATEMAPPIPVGEATELESPAQARQTAEDNLARWMERAAPVDLKRAREMVRQAAELGKGDFTVVPHTAGGFTVVPKAWMPPGMAQELMRAVWPTAQIPVGDAAEMIPVGEVVKPERRVRPIPVGEATDLGPAELIEPTAEAPPEVTRTPRSNTSAVAADLSSGDAGIDQYVARMRATNTDAARAFVRDFDTGRITRDDVRKLVFQEPAATDQQVANQRLEAAAGEAPKALPGDLLTADGMPYGTRAAAAVRATREGGGSVVEVAGGYVVRQEPAQGALVPAEQPAAAAETAATPGPSASQGPGTFGEKDAFLKTLSDDQLRKVVKKLGQPTYQQGNGVSATTARNLHEAAARGFSLTELQAAAAPGPANAKAMAAEEKAAGGNPHVWAGRAAYKSGMRGVIPPEYTDRTGANAQAWMRGWVEARAEEREAPTLAQRVNAKRQKTAKPPAQDLFSQAAQDQQAPPPPPPPPAAAAVKEDEDRDWTTATVDEIYDEIDRLYEAWRVAQKAQLEMELDSPERRRELIKMDQLDRQREALEKLLPDDEAQQEEEAPEPKFGDPDYVPPENWEGSLYQARQYAREMGFQIYGEGPDILTGKDLAQVVAMIKKKLGKPTLKERVKKKAASVAPMTEEAVKTAEDAITTGGEIVEQDGKIYVRIGNDRALQGPIKSRELAQALIDATIPNEPALPPGVTLLEADEGAFAAALKDVPADDDPRVEALFKSSREPRNPTKGGFGGAYRTLEEAQSSIEDWKKAAKKQTGNSDWTVISLFDYTGQWAKPWADAGYNVVTIDLQDGEDISEFTAESLLDRFGNDNVWAILAAPPCTDFASSGAQYWKTKDADGRTEASNELVRQVLRTVELLRPAVWAMENPVGRLPKLIRLPPPLLTFQPNLYGDPYTKKTLLWGNFNNALVMNPVAPTEGSKITEKLSSSNKVARSATPEGFAYSFFNANNQLTGFQGPTGSVGERLAQEFHGIEADLFAAARFGNPPYVGRKEITQDRIKHLIEDAYNDGDLDEVRGILERLAADDRPKTPAPDLKGRVEAKRKSAPKKAVSPAGETTAATETAPAAVDYSRRAKDDWNDSYGVTAEDFAVAIRASSGEDAGLNSLGLVSTYATSPASRDAAPQAEAAAYQAERTNKLREAADKADASFERDLERQGKGTFDDMAANLSKYADHPVRVQKIMARYRAIGGAQARQASALLDRIKPLWKYGQFQRAGEILRAAAKTRSAFNRAYDINAGALSDQLKTELDVKLEKEGTSRLGSLGPNRAADVLAALGYRQDGVYKAKATKRPPISFRRNFVVTTQVYDEESGRFQQQEVDAEAALKALDDDIAELEAFKRCLGD